jgi:hypothetical protein
VLWIAAAWAWSGCAGLASDERPPRVDLDIVAGELSGIAPVAGGYLVAEDELVGSVLFVPAPSVEAGRAQTTIVKFERARRDAEPFASRQRLWPVQDVEALASDGVSAVFVLGSHNPKHGERRPDREFLLGLEWRLDRRELRLTLDTREQRHLIDRIDEALRHACQGNPALCIPLHPNDGRVAGRLNLEGLAYDPQDRELYVGLRGPRTASGDALVIRMPVGTAFSSTPEPGARVLPVDLDGGGVTDLAWDPWRDRLLLVSGPERDDPDALSSIYTLDPNSGRIERPYTFPAEVVRERGRPEGIAVTRDAGLWLVFDLSTRPPALWHYPEVGG